ncbi:MAG: efflux RND transporter periplasmic adaptor subunit [Calditerrivibrio sp.]|nr:efflux RND transporter periplasmic adaptor subunit [Calditerrivibrio sp.]
MKLTKGIISIIFGIIAIGLIFWGYKKLITKPLSMPPQMQIQFSVDVYKIDKSKTLEIPIEYPARIVQFSSVNIVSRVSGILLKKHIKDGSFVKKGDLLFSIEPDLYLAKVKQAEGNLEQAKANLIRAKSEFERTKKLYEEKISSQQDYESVLSNYESAKAILKNAEGALEIAKLELSYTKIYSPTDGIAHIKLVDEGNYITPGTHLITINKIDPVYIEFSIPDSDNKKYSIVSSIQKGLIKPVISENRFVGRFDFVDNLMEATTGTIKVRTIFDNKNNKLIPGDFTRLLLLGLKSNEGVKIPSKAIIQTSSGPIVYVVKNGTIVVKPISIFREEGDFSIVKGDFNDKDDVVVNNLLKIKPGINVKVDRVINQEQK